MFFTSIMTNMLGCASVGVGVCASVGHTTKKGTSV